MKKKCLVELKLDHINTIIRRLDQCQNAIQMYNAIVVSVEDFEKDLIKNKLLRNCND